MTPHDYTDAAHRTLSTQWHADKLHGLEFMCAMAAAVAAVGQLDKLKKAIFYGKNLPAVIDGNITVDTLFAQVQLPPDMTVQEFRNVVHAVIGKMTEAAEMADILMQAIDTGTLDVAHMREELGDGFWYDAIAARALGTTYPAEMNRNIAKLRARFPEKFDAAQAITRNLDAEQHAMQSIPVGNTK